MASVYKRSQRRAAINSGKQISEPVNPKAFEAEVRKGHPKKKKRSKGGY